MQQPEPNQIPPAPNLSCSECISKSRIQKPLLAQARFNLAGWVWVWGHQSWASDCKQPPDLHTHTPTIVRCSSVTKLLVHAATPTTAHIHLLDPPTSDSTLSPTIYPTTPHHRASPRAPRRRRRSRSKGTGGTDARQSKPGRLTHRCCR